MTPPRPVNVLTRVPALFVGAQNGSAWGRPQVSATFFVPDKNKTYTVIYPGRGSVSQSVVDLLKGLKPKDPVQITVDAFLGKGILTNISTVRVREGEDKPSVYVFEGKKTARTGQVGVTLSKSLRSQTVLLGGQDGSSQDNPLLAAVDKLKPDDLVYVQVEHENGRPVVTRIEPYHPPLTGEFVKFNPPAAGESACSIEVRTDAGVRTFSLPKRTIGTRELPDPKLRQAAQRLRPGQNVELHVDDTGDNTLIDVWPAPNQPDDKKTDVARAP